MQSKKHSQQQQNSDPNVYIFHVKVPSIGAVADAVKSGDVRKMKELLKGFQHGLNFLNAMIAEPMKNLENAIKEAEKKQKPQTREEIMAAASAAASVAATAAVTEYLGSLCNTSGGRDVSGGHGGRGATQCKFFNKQGGCTNRDCEFIHENPKSTDDASDGCGGRVDRDKELGPPSVSSSEDESTTDGRDFPAPDVQPPMSQDI